MKKDQKISEALRFDMRLIERSIRNGMLDKKDYENFLKTLPDESSKSRYIEVYEEKIEDDSALAESLTFTSG